MKTERNVNGRAPAGAKVWADFSEQEKAKYMDRIERLSGVEFLTVCRRLDSEMEALRKLEGEEKKRK